MKTELLVLYPQKSSENFKKTLSMINDGLKKEKLNFKSSSFDEVEVFLDEGKVEVFFGDLELDDVENIFFRKVGCNKEVAFLIATLARKKGINFVDKLFAEFYNSTKLTQTFLFHLKNIPAPKTYFSPTYDKKKFLKAANFLGYPLVVKKCSSSRGEGVSLVENEEQIEAKINSFSGEQIILQEFIQNDFEYRVLVVENEVAVVEKKQRDKNSNEFRNNVHLGAKEEFLAVHSVDSDLKDLALCAARAVNIQIAGVDVIEDVEGERFVTEVNRTPAFTHDKKISDEIPNLINFLTKWVKKG